MTEAMRSRKEAAEAVVAMVESAENVFAALNERGDEVSPPPPRIGDEMPKMSPWVRRLVESVFLKSDEVEASSERLRREMSLGDRRTDYGSVIAALDRAEENVRLAFELAITIKAERDAYEISVQVVEAGMRARAIEQLDRERADAKQAGGKSKTITEADVSLKIAALYTDEWENLVFERRRMELAVRFHDHQVENWGSRCRSLQVLAQKLR
jgi:hypothetical protein